MPKDLAAPITSELSQDVLSPINLFELTLLNGDVLRYAQATEDIFFAGQTYTAYPIERETLRTSTEEVIDNIRIATANADRNLTTLLHQEDGLRGAGVRVLVVFQNLLSDPNNKIISFDGLISSCKIVPDMIIFDVMSRLDIQYLELPGRVFRSDRCQWTYKDANTCQYSGALPTCSKVLGGPNGCRAHDNVTNYGGFPGIPEKRTTVF